MRKFVKEQIYNIINQISIIMDKSIYSMNVVDELGQCQQEIINIGQVVEDECGEDFITVHYIEDCIDEIYNLSLVCGDKDKFKSDVKHIRQSLTNIVNSIKNDVPNTYEILFMPYNVTMWDALASVYEAAKNAENCNVTVMPVPYYNITPNGEIVDTKYDGFEFPIDIQLTDYNRYSIEENRPDVIFIHNPYDEYNNVTRLPEKYYSSELKKYTEHLVYIPYFVSFSDNIDADFYILPGVKNSWRTFVQSEALRKNYIKYNNADKIVALGSPKIDNIIKLEKNKPEIPKEWEKILGGKKIFLYNTHLSGILNNPEQLIEKLRRVFNCFVGRSDIALLWRPHPLSIATIKSRKLNILNDYLRMIEEYKNMGIGVYDDTKDVGRAMAIADAYIGDNSSLVQMFGVTGKPIFIQEQDIEMCNSANFRFLFGNVYCYYNDYVYISSNNLNMVVRCNLNTGKIEKIGMFDTSKLLRNSLGNRFLVNNDKIYVLPWAANSIIEYDMDSGKSVNYQIERKSEWDRYVSKTIYKNEIYMIPWNLNDNILLFNVDNKTISNDKALSDKELIISNIAVDENYIYVVSAASKFIIKFNMENKKKEMFSIGDYTGYKNILVTEKDIWLLNLSGEIIKYDKQNKEFKSYKLNSNINEYFQMIYVNNQMWIFSKTTFEAVCFNAQNEKMEYINFYSENISLYNKQYLKFGLFTEPNIVDDCIILNSALADKAIKINIFTKEITFEDICIMPEEWYNEICGEALKNANEIYHGENIDIDKYINAVSSGNMKVCSQKNNQFAKYVDNADGTSGEKIWKYIYNELD